jgi:hypothetical protein
MPLFPQHPRDLEADPARSSCDDRRPLRHLRPFPRGLVVVNSRNQTTPEHVAHPREQGAVSRSEPTVDPRGVEATTRQIAGTVCLTAHSPARGGPVAQLVRAGDS